MVMEPPADVYECYRVCLLSMLTSIKKKSIVCVYNLSIRLSGRKLFQFVE